MTLIDLLHQHQRTWDGMCTALTYPEQERRRKAATKAEKCLKAELNKAERKATGYESQKQSTEGA